MLILVSYGLFKIIISITKLCRQASTTRKQMHLGTRPPTREISTMSHCKFEHFLINYCPMSPLQVDRQNFHRNGNEKMTVGIITVIAMVLL